MLLKNKKGFIFAPAKENNDVVILRKSSLKD